MRCSRCGENTLTPAGRHSDNEAACDCWIELETCEGCEDEYNPSDLVITLNMKNEEVTLCECCSEEEGYKREEKSDSVKDGCCIYCLSSLKVFEGVYGYPSCIDCRKVQLASYSRIDR